MAEQPQIYIECRECEFSNTFGPDAGTRPARTVIQHGRKTGHQLTVESQPDGSRPSPSP